MTPSDYRKLRKEIDSQKKVALLLGITRFAISRRENGRAPITKEAKLAIKRLREMNGSRCSVPRDLLESLLENTCELRGEREWWKDEPRCNYQRDYQRYLDEIAAIEEILRENSR